MNGLAMKSTERDLNRMLGDYLSARTASAKHLAREIGCDPRTAEGFRAGRHWPQAKHWAGLIATFGRDLTDAVFHPSEAAERLEREARELEQQAEAKRRMARQVAGDARRVAQAHRRPESRTFVTPDDD